MNENASKFMKVIKTIVRSLLWYIVKSECHVQDPDMHEHYRKWKVKKWKVKENLWKSNKNGSVGEFYASVHGEWIVSNKYETLIWWTPSVNGYSEWWMKIKETEEKEIKWESWQVLCFDTWWVNSE